MKQWQFWSLVFGLVATLFTLGGYGNSISAFAATLASRVTFLEKQREEDKNDLKYIRDRVDAIYLRFQKE